MKKRIVWIFHSYFCCMSYILCSSAVTNWMVGGWELNFICERYLSPLWDSFQMVSSLFVKISFQHYLPVTYQPIQHTARNLNSTAFHTTWEWHQLQKALQLKYIYGQKFETADNWENGNFVISLSTYVIIWILKTCIL